MPRFANMLVDGMKQRGHTSEIWTATPALYNRVPPSLKKWMGYIDQYILFPKEVRKKLKTTAKDTLFVFTDQALGPWVPLVKNRPHAIHCHDFLAQRSALGEIPENKTSRSGQMYQTYIRKGYQQGRNFISVSQKTKQDLQRFLKQTPALSEVVYNGMNQTIEHTDAAAARAMLTQQTGITLLNGYLLHVGGNLWYKNRKSVVDLYNQWRSKSRFSLPLLLIGETPDTALRKKYNESSYKTDIHFISDADDTFVRLAYSGASLFLFPSLAEGFGWPIAEAMAHGCLVITTSEAPMTEVAGEAGFLIPSQSQYRNDLQSWNEKGVLAIETVLNLSPEEKEIAVTKGLLNIKRFDTNSALDQIEIIYQKILKKG